MPYSKISELPEGTSKLPSGAKNIYMKAYNAAYTKGWPEDRRHSYAWGAVKRRYKKVGDKWVKKSFSMSEITEEDFDLYKGDDLTELVAVIVSAFERSRR